MTAVAFVVMTLAVARVVRLVTTDDLTEPVRKWLARRWSPVDGPGFLVRLASCDWCVGVWIAAAAALIGYGTGLVTTWAWAAWSWLGMAMGSGLVLKWAD